MMTKLTGEGVGVGEGDGERVGVGEGLGPGEPEGLTDGWGEALMIGAVDELQPPVATTAKRKTATAHSASAFIAGVTKNLDNPLTIFSP
jgi:hypothetical protein